MRRAACLVTLALIALAPLGCGGSGSKPKAQQAACESVYGDALRQMRSFMAEVGAGMTVGTFNQSYPKLAGPVQLAKDAAHGSDCPAEIGVKVNALYRRIKSDSQDPSTIKRWNTDYDALRSERAALP